MCSSPQLQPPRHSCVFYDQRLKRPYKRCFEASPIHVVHRTYFTVLSLVVCPRNTKTSNVSGCNAIGLTYRQIPFKLIASTIITLEHALYIYNPQRKQSIFPNGEKTRLHLLSVVRDQTELRTPVMNGDICLYRLVQITMGQDSI
jgi:hypothetical protein